MVVFVGQKARGGGVSEGVSAKERHSRLGNERMVRIQTKVVNG